MTFTAYDIESGLDRDTVRFVVGDTVENEGPRPDGRNFSDEEIAFAVTAESSVVYAACAFCFEILASEWSQFALVDRKDNVSVDAKQVASEYQKRADYWRKKSNTVPKQQASFKAHVISSW
jgi:hypothetical protein